MLSVLGRVEGRRVDYRVRWLFRRFRFGPQSGSLITFPVPALRTGRAVFPHLGSPVGSCVSHTGPRSHPWTTPMGLAPVPYSIHVRSRSAARPIDALTTPSSSDDPFTFACDASGVSGPLPGFQAFATPGTLPPSVTAPHLRPLPSTGITRLLQYYQPLRHPAGPASPSRGPGSVHASPPTGLPMLLPSSPSMRASATTPAGPEGCPRRSLPPPSSAPFLRWVGFRIARFEACSTFTRVPARMFAEPPKAALCHQGASDPIVASMIRPGCYQPERQLLDGFRTRWKKAPFHGALRNAG